MSPSGRLLACQHTEMGFQQPKHPMILGPRPTSDTSPADMAKPCHFQMNLPLEVSRFQVPQPRESQLEPLLILPSNFCCYHPCISWGWLQVKYRARQTSCSSSCHVQIWVQHYSFTFFFSMAHYGIHHEEKVLLVDSTGSHRFKRWKPLELRCSWGWWKICMTDAAVAEISAFLTTLTLATKNPSKSASNWRKKLQILCLSSSGVAW